MKIEWVNHASFIVDHQGARLITDPWFEGPVFDNGWDLLSRTQHNYEDYKEISHIWFSHEHPDHFNPLNLKKIPVEYRQNITILFQETKDKKVIDFCKNVLGFTKIIELKKDNWHQIGNDLSILCNPHNDDSWCCIKSSEYSLLNLNDCIIKSADQVNKIKAKVGKIDLLLTQFSYANWVGNIGENEQMKKHALEKLDRMQLQIKSLSPKWVIPFASFVWFCHKENDYLNQEANNISQVYEFLLRTNAIPIVMYPKDSWVLGEDHESNPAIAKYEHDREQIQYRPRITPCKTSVSDRSQLFSDSHEFADKIKAKNSKIALFFLKPAYVHLTDIGTVYSLTLGKGLYESRRHRDSADISLSVDALSYCFNYLWGGDTLQVNGRFQVPRSGDLENFRKYFIISSLNNNGNHYNLRYLIWLFFQKIRRRIRL